MDEFLNEVRDFCQKFHHLEAEERLREFHVLMDKGSYSDACDFITMLMNNSLDAEVIELLKCLQNLYPVLEGLTESSKFEELLKSVSTAKNPVIQCILLKPYGIDKVVNQGLSTFNILKEAINWLKSDNLELSEASSEVIRNILTKCPSFLHIGLELVVDNGSSVSSDSILILRYCQVLSRLCRNGDFHFQQVQGSGGLQLILDQCRSPDVLLSILAIDFLTDIAYSSSGIMYLIEHGHVSWLMQLACGNDANGAPDPLLGGQALRTLGGMFEKAAVLNVRIWDLEEGFGGDRLGPSFIRAILRHVESSDEASLLIGLHAISSFAASSPAACRIVLLDRALRESWLAFLTRKIELQSTALHTVARVLIASDGEEDEASPSLKDLKRDLFLNIGIVRNQATMVYLLKLAREPVPLLKYAAYDVLRSLAMQSSGWGVELLMSPSGGPDSPWGCSLCDVSTECDKKGKEWKFSVIEAIAQCPKTEFLVDDLKMDIRERLRRGPFFAHAKLAELQTMEL